MIGAGFSSLSPQISFFSENIISTINCWRFEKSSPVIVHGYLLWNGKGGKRKPSMRAFYFYSEKGKGALGGIENAKLEMMTIWCFFLKTFFKEYWFNVNLLSQVLELDNHERNMWPISVINLKLNFFGRIYIFFVDFHSYYKAGSIIDMVILYSLLKILSVCCIKCPLILPRILMKE